MATSSSPPAPSTPVTPSSPITIVSPPTPPSKPTSNFSPATGPTAFRKHSPCPMYEIVQYACQPHFRYDEVTGERFAGGTVTCYPIPRVFRKCPGQPAVDVSKVLQDNNGVFPLDQPLPKGQPWDKVKPPKRDPFRLNM